jgi:serine/threonine protein kinase/formylglycine-generating enzyme required for sulfatase activity
VDERELFLAGLEIEDPAVRQAYLQAACANNAELLASVESLLASHEGESLFLQVPVGDQLEVTAPGNEATVFIQNASTHDDNGGEPSHALFERDSMKPNRNEETDEIPLGYLESPTRPDSLGRLGHYEVLEVVGRGAFGTVLRAFDEKLQRVVAIKVLAIELASTSPARKRFLREAQSSAQIRHEHVVSVYAVEEKPIPYLVMEYIPGQTLQQKLDTTGPLDVLTVLRLGGQIAEGLAAAHAMDLIHRDIKPGNILLETGVRDRVKITDFGLARTADDASMTQSGIIAGTPMYMAPEQALGHKLDQRADLFSLGSVLYQMVSGRPPFRASSTLAVLKRLTEDTPRPIQEVIPETPQWLCDIISKLHAKHPEERFQTAREVADVLADCEAQLKANAKLKDYSRIPKSKQPASRKPGRRKWVAAAALFLPVIAFAVTELAGVTQLFRGQQGEPVKPGDEPVADGTTPARHDQFPDAPPRKAPLDAQQAKYQAQWRESAKVHLAAVRSNPADRSAWIKAAPLLILAGDDEGYRQLCRDMLKQFLDPAQAEIADSVCKVCLLRPNVIDPSMLPTGRVRGAIGSQDWPDFQAYFIACAALIAYREGDMPHAIEWAHKLAVGPSAPDLTGHTIRAMALHRLGRVDDARQALTAVEATIPDELRPYAAATNLNTVPFPESPLSYDLWHFVILYREAVRLINPTGQADPPPLAIAPFDAAQAKAHQEAWASHLGVPVEFENSVGMKFVLIPPGEFTRGTADGDPRTDDWDMVDDGRPSSRPQHRVRISRPCYAGTHEVTLEQFRAFVQATGYVTDAERSGHGSWYWNEATELIERKADLIWKSPGYEVGANFPVSAVTCRDAAQFCDWLSKKEGRTYRLPTEAEWEFACRAGTTTAYAFGSELMTQNAVFERHPSAGPIAVGSRPANGFGLHDMHGNVHEWCADGPREYTTAAATDPAGPDRGGPDREMRVYRGGSYAEYVGAHLGLQSSGRRASDPGHPDVARGFRVVVVGDLTPKPVASAPFTDADVQRIAALPASEQVEEVRKELVRRNPGFDGKVEHKIEDGVVIILQFCTDDITDISPVRALKGLRLLECASSDVGTGKLVDLSPLRGIPIVELRLWFNQVVDLSPLRDSPLRILDITGNPVTDIAPVKTLKIEWLNVRGMPLTDLTLLKEMPLKELHVDLQTQQDIEIVRAIKTLETINGKPAAEFWKEVDEK